MTDSIDITAEDPAEITAKQRASGMARNAVLDYHIDMLRQTLNSYLRSGSRAQKCAIRDAIVAVQALRWDDPSNTQN